MASSFPRPNIFIYLVAIFRPTSLQPHLRVPTIGHIDFRGLRRVGFNAVVIDKDNCITLPEKDDVYPPLAVAWKRLLSTFDPGRVLIVSNSAGTAKDPDAIAAEAVTLSLRTPILRHSRPKPGCAPDIISYFSSLPAPKPYTVQGEIHARAEEVSSQETAEEDEVIARWEKEFVGPLLGGARTDVRGLKSGEMEGRMMAKQKETAGSGNEAETESVSVSQAREAGRIIQDSSVLVGKTSRTQSGDGESSEPLKILVIGDRLFTDTLLANQLSRILPSTSVTSPDTPAASFSPPTNVISILTTQHPQPKDVRFLRWAEERLSKGRIRASTTDWGRFTLDPTSPSSSNDQGEAGSIDPLSIFGERRQLTLKERLNPFRDTPALTWHPRSWRPKPLLLALCLSLGWTARQIWRGLSILAARVWDGEVNVARALLDKQDPKRDAASPVPNEVKVKLVGEHQLPAQQQ